MSLGLESETGRLHRENFRGSNHVLISQIQIAANQRAAALLGLVAVILGIAVLAGWKFDLTELKTIMPGMVAMAINTALNGIIGFSEFLADGLPGSLNSKQQEYLGDILNSGRHLLQLINDILDLAKVEAGKIDIVPETFNLRRALAEVRAVSEPLAQKKNIQVSLNIDPEMDEVTLDQKRFKQVVYNLLSNAVKFTDGGGNVEINCNACGEQQLKLSVRDSGIGIKPENLKRLFKEFEQIESGTARRYEGTVLGLAPTRKIVEMQGGSITVASEVGKGTTFTVVLPCVSVAA